MVLFFFKLFLSKELWWFLSGDSLRVRHEPAEWTGCCIGHLSMTHDAESTAEFTTRSIIQGQQSMDARISQPATVSLLMRMSLVLCVVFVCTGATHRTRNFTVHAPDANIARKVALTAERCRVDLAKQWLGKELPPWRKPCPIKVKVGQIGAGGATRFSFDRGEVFNWNMQVQGSLERIIDSVIPHEVNHTILACYFRRPIPRWADEGAATICEHKSERTRQLMLLQDILNEKRRMPLQQLLSIKEYPREMDQVLTLYAEGYSLTDFLVQQRGRATFLKFLNDAHTQGWEAAIQKNYRHNNVQSLEKQWQGWFLAGSPRLDLHREQMLASNDGVDRSAARPSLSVRGQNPDRRSGDSTRRSSAAGSSTRTSAPLYNKSARSSRVRAPAPVDASAGHGQSRPPASMWSRQSASTTSRSRTPIQHNGSSTLRDTRVTNEFTGTYEFQ